MAFTQEQKNNLTLLEEAPEKFLEKIKNGSVILSEYKNEYSRGGIGLSHYLINFLSKDSQKYKDVATEIWNNSSISIGDLYKEDITPINHAFSLLKSVSHFYSDNKESLNTLFDIVKIAPLQINDEDFSRVLHTFFMNEEFEKFNYLLDKNKKVIPNIYWQRIFEKIITENDILQLKNITERLDDKNDITRIEWALSGRVKNMNHEKSSLLICAIRYSDEIAHYFLDEFKFPLNGRVKFDMPNTNHYTDRLSEANLYRTDFPSHTRHEKKIIYSATHPLNEAREMEKLEIFNKIIHNLGNNSIPHLMYEEKITKKIKKEKNSYSYSSRPDEYEPSKSIIKHILSTPHNDFYNSIKTNISTIIKDNRNNNKMDFISQILGNKELEYKEKYFFAQAIIPNIGEFEKYKDDYSFNRAAINNHLYILDTFLTDLYSKELSFKDINFASEILDLALKNPNPAFSNNVMYSSQLYKNNDLLNGFIAGGLDLTKDYNNNKTVNPFYFYYQLKNRSYGYDHDITLSQDDINKINKNFNTLKLLGGDNLYLPIPSQDYGHNVPNRNLLNYALSKLSSLLINNFSDDEIIKFSNFHSEIYPISAIATPTLNKENIPNEKDLNIYRNITKRMFNLGFKFFNEDKPDDFYKLLSFHNDMNFISNVLAKENKNIAELSKDLNFWKHINNEQISQYVHDHGAIFNSLDMTLDIAHLDDFDNQVFNLYIKKGGNISYSEEKDNILHYLVKKDLYKQASHVINLYPELSEEVNKQNKIPLQYMMVSLNREAGQHQHSRSSFFPAQKEFFENYLDVGKFSDNKKSLKFLNEQISKYSSIEKLVPHLKEIMNYKMIDAVTKPDPEDKKIKIRNKI